MYEIILTKRQLSKVGSYGTRDFLIEAKLKHFLKSHFLELKIRSSLSDNGLIIANGSGEIDLDYPKEICLLIHNPIFFTKWNAYERKYERFGALRQDKFFINKGDKVAQIKLMEHKSYLMSYDSDKIREDGFGSTGDKRL